ncbi:hypothetical protein ACFORH_30825 [Amycolatopsis roodepoortensis]|uniref:Uncharacterized protein n=1 Tax=Amycolatopsis roodepoortensis TaxID=700274 RepID=A0ABR9KXK5_9PSEU|nr:hypothetical protein [Amycolatopsis roodepoortensis]MBE1573093.1 hypothetical protein [Amycolatopsis roodepoortensis]
MAIDYEAWCAEEPRVASVARVATVTMRLLLGVDNIEIVVTGEAELTWSFSWGSAAGARVMVMGPEYAEIPGRWSVFAAADSRGVDLDELLSLMIVIAAGVVHGGEVVDESGRLAQRVNEPGELMLKVLRSGEREPARLVECLKS